MTKPIVSVTKLTKTYFPSPFARWRGAQSFTAVNDVSFSLHEGEVLGLLGPNGAGKTTTTQMMLGTLTPTGGSIAYFGKDFYAHRSEILQQISFASAYTRLPAQLTIWENLDFFGRLHDLSASDRASRIKEFLNFFNMWELRDRETNSLSAGQMTRVMLAKAFLTRPKALLLDEPTASLDPDVAHETLKFIREQQKQEGLSILFTSHNMEEVVDLCGRVLVLQDGVIIANDTPSVLAASVKKARVALVMNEENLARAIAFTQEQILKHEVEGNRITIEVDERTVGQMLSSLGAARVGYDQISIDKPTLKDYFLHIARESRAKKRAKKKGKK